MNNKIPFPAFDPIFVKFDDPQSIRVDRTDHIEEILLL